MFGLQTLDIIIGLAAVYSVFALACTAIVETLSAWASLRAKTLEDGLRELLAGKISGDKDFIDAFYAHPLVQSLSKGTQGRPSYIPPKIVSLVICALIGASRSLPAQLNLPGSADNNRIKGLLQTFIDEANTDLNIFRESIEMQFDATMDRANGWFKRHTQAIALIAATILVGGANLDSLALIRALANSPEARVQMVGVANELASKAEANTIGDTDPLTHALDASQSATAKLTQAKNTLAAAQLPMGWTERPQQGYEWLTKAVGLVLSIFAVSLGAPFWFDLLQRFIKIRSSGISPRDAETRPRESGRAEN